MIFVTGELPYLTNFNFSIIDIVLVSRLTNVQNVFGVGWRQCGRPSFQLTVL